MLLELGLKTLLGYLLGSLMGGLIVGRHSGGVDIRSVGSGNVGGTNALRTPGRKSAFWVVLIDVIKGVIAAAVLPQLRIPGVDIEPMVRRDWFRNGVRCRRRGRACVPGLVRISRWQGRSDTGRNSAGDPAGIAHSGAGTISL